MAHLIEATTQYIIGNPKVLLTQGAAIGVAVFALPVATPVLGMLGFSAAGPVAGK